MKEIKGKSILVRASELSGVDCISNSLLFFFLQSTNLSMDFITLLDRLMIKGSTTTLIAYPIGRVIFDHTAETKCQ